MREGKEEADATIADRKAGLKTKKRIKPAPLKSEPVGDSGTRPRSSGPKRVRLPRE